MTLATLQQLRTFEFDNHPIDLEEGQLAFSLAAANIDSAAGDYNIYMYVGNGSNTRIDDGGTVLAAGGTNGKGWIRFRLKNVSVRGDSVYGNLNVVNSNFRVFKQGNSGSAELLIPTQLDTGVNGALSGSLRWNTQASILQAWNGNKWDTTSKVTVSTTAPTNPSAGDMWYDTGTSNLKIWTGSSFVAAIGVGAAGGSNTQVQFNSTGTLSGSSNFTFDGTTASMAGLAVTGSSIFRAAATQDGVAIVGRAGGTSSYEVTFTPTTLTADRIQTLQDAAGTVALNGNNLSFFAATTSAQLAGVISDETGSGALVFATSPTLVTPVLGVASATSVNKVAITAPATSATLTIANGKTLTASNTLTFTGTDTSSVAFGTGGTVAYTANKLSVFAATTSSELAGVISDETGSGALVFATSPTFVTPVLGVATGTSFNSITGLSSTNPAALGAVAVGTGTTTARADHVHPTTGLGLTSGTLAQFAATTSSQLAGVISDETGSGALVFATSPSLTTPTLGVASATSINKVAITAPATSATLTIANGKTLTASNTLTFTGTDTSSVAFGTGGTVAYTANKLSVFAATTSAELAGVISDETGSGALVFATSPTLVTPVLGTPSSGNLSNCTNVPAGQLSGTIPSGVLGASSLFIGTTSVTLNRGSGVLALTGMGTITPNADNTSDLGSGSLRWANVYTGDLHLKNDRGDYTIIEEEDALTLRNNKTGKVYNFVLQERV